MSVHPYWFIFAEFLSYFHKGSKALAFHSLMDCVACASNVRSETMSSVAMVIWWCSTSALHKVCALRWCCWAASGCTLLAPLQWESPLLCRTAAAANSVGLSCLLYCLAAAQKANCTERAQAAVLRLALTIPFISVAVGAALQQSQKKKKYSFLVQNGMVLKFCFGKKKLKKNYCKLYLLSTFFVLFSFSATDAAKQLFPWPWYLTIHQWSGVVNEIHYLLNINTGSEINVW